MNEKGFFGFLLILILFTLTLFLVLESNQNKKTLLETKNELIKAEENHKKRTLLENNIDKIIETKLLEQIISQNFNLEKAKNNINTALYNYLSDKVNTVNNSTQKLSPNFLKQNSVVVILKSKEVTYAEYVYAPTPITTKLTQRFGEKMVIDFVLPNNYSRKIIIPV